MGRNNVNFGNFTVAFFAILILILVVSFIFSSPKESPSKVEAEERTIIKEQLETSELILEDGSRNHYLTGVLDEGIQITTVYRSGEEKIPVTSFYSYQLEGKSNFFKSERKFKIKDFDLKKGKVEIEIFN